MSNVVGDWIAHIELSPDHYAPSALGIESDGTVQDEMADTGKWTSVGDQVLIRFDQFEVTYTAVITGDVMIGVYGFAEEARKGRWYAIRRGTVTT